MGNIRVATLYLGVASEPPGERRSVEIKALREKKDLCVSTSKEKKRKKKEEQQEIEQKRIQAWMDLGGAGKWRAPSSRAEGPAQEARLAR